MRNILILAVLSSGLAILAIVYGTKSTPPDVPEDTAPDAQNVPTEAVYETKVVYGVGSEISVSESKKDCDARGGTFNECGSPCAPDAESCIEVCAYTCELGSQEEETVVPPAQNTHPLIKTDSPSPNETIESPLTIRGEARGTWFFEATFPIVLVDWDGLIIAEGYAEATDDWMTEQFVPYEATFTFESPVTENSPEFMHRGTLIFQKANPSGLPEHADAYEIPVQFQAR